MKIFGFTDYKEFIRHQLIQNKHIKGYQSTLAQAAECQRPYLSQVLRGKGQLSYDQAAGLAEFWSLNEDESDYFIELLHLARAGTPRLKAIISRKISKLKMTQYDLANRYKKPQLNSLEQEALYYSSWSVAAIHILISIPGFTEPTKIAHRLNLSEKEVHESLHKLEFIGLAKQTTSGWISTLQHIHLAKKSPLNIINLLNWRHLALLNARKSGENSVHYTGIHSISNHDFLTFKDKVVESIDQLHTAVSTSEPQELICINLDYFKI